MAYTKIWDIKEKTERTLSYVVQPGKSENGTLAFSGNCSINPGIADVQMQKHRQKYGKDSRNLLYHGCVSFKKGEISEERALAYAKDWMDWRFHNYQYLASIHTDTDHVHFNFVINSVDLDGKKYNDCNRTLAELRAWTDILCERYGLSIIQPKGKGVSYKKWMEEKRKPSWQPQVRADIDSVISKAEDFDDFLEKMREMGYYIKHGENVKHTLYKKPGMERGSRGSTLGENYTDEAIRERIRLKEFQMTAVRSPRKLRREWTPLQKEIYRLEHIHNPYLSSVIALGLHTVLDHWHGCESKLSTKKRFYWKNQYAKKVDKLAEQLVFVRSHNIRSVDVLKERIESLERDKERIRVLIEAERKVFRQEKGDVTKKIKVLQKQEREVNAQLKKYQAVLDTWNEIQENTLCPEPALEQEAKKQSETRQGGMTRDGSWK